MRQPTLPVRHKLNYQAWTGTLEYDHNTFSIYDRTMFSISVTMLSDCPSETRTKDIKILRKLGLKVQMNSNNITYPDYQPWISGKKINENVLFYFIFKKFQDTQKIVQNT